MTTRASSVWNVGNGFRSPSLGLLPHQLKKSLGLLRLRYPARGALKNHCLENRLRQSGHG